MDTKEYISSGIIEAFVMGTASEEEVRILHCIQEHNPEVREAVLEAQLTIEQLASSQAVIPPPELKATIWNKLSGEESSQSPLHDIRPEFVAASEPSVSNEKSLSFKWSLVAASLALVFSIGLNIYLIQVRRDRDAQIVALSNAQKSSSLENRRLQEKWALASNPKMKIIPLLGVGSHPDMKAIVYFDREAKSVYLTLENLPKTAPDKQYQLWAIVNGAPVSLGVFQQEDNVVQKMTDAADAQAFAITLEKAGGSSVPTMSNMYVMGKV